MGTCEEVLSGPLQLDDIDVRTCIRLQKRVVQLGDHRPCNGITLLRPIERNARYTLLDIEQDRVGGFEKLAHGLPSYSRPLMPMVCGTAREAPPCSPCR